MPKRKTQARHSSDDDFVVTTEESESEDEYATPTEDVSEESDSPPPKQVETSPPPRSSRRQSQRTPALGTRRRKEAQLSALEKLKSARKALETRKKAAPRRTRTPLKQPDPEPTDTDTDTDTDTAPEDNNNSEDSWTEREKSVSPPPTRKRARGRAFAATTIAARLGSNTSKRAQKPSQLLLGHRDYAERDGGRGGDGGSYTDDEDLAAFIASSSGEEEESEEESSEDVSSEQEEEEKFEAGLKTKITAATIAKRKAAADSMRKAKEKAKVSSRKEIMVVKKGKKQQTQHFESEKEKERTTDDEKEEEEEEERFLASAERRRLKQMRPKVEVIIDSSSSESEEDIDAVLAATTTAAAAAAAGGVLNSNAGTPQDDGLKNRKRLRRISDIKGDFDEKDGSTSPRSLQDQKEKKKSAAAEKEKESIPLNAVSEKKNLPQPSKEENLRKFIQEQKNRPRLSAAERIAQAQAAFIAKTDPSIIENNESSGDDDDDFAKEEEENEDGGGELTDEGEPSDSAGSLRDLIVEDEEENEQDVAEGENQIRQIRPLDDEDCFYNYVEYLLMCYVDPTYRARINESQEHRDHFQHSVRRIETKMTTARDAVHSEAWRSCSRGLLEAVEWLPGAQSCWDPDMITNNPEYAEYNDHYNERDLYGEVDHIKCAACNRRNSHATRTIIFKGRPRPPPKDEVWEDKPANKKLSEKYLAASPVYKKNRKRRGGSYNERAIIGGGSGDGGGVRVTALVGRQGGGRRGFQMGFRDGDDREHEYDSDDSLSRFIRSARTSIVYAGEENSTDEGEEHENDNDGAGPSHSVSIPKADAPFDPEEGPSGHYIKREFPVGRQCSARLMLYHGMFHWKHRLLARLKFELKEERRRRRRANLPIDPGSVSDGVLSREPLIRALWNNFKELTAMGEAHQLAGGEIGNSAWRGGPAVDPHRQVTAVLAALHDDSDGEESDIVWGYAGEERNHQNGAGGGGGGGTEDDEEELESIGDRKRRRIAKMYKKQHQRDPALPGNTTAAISSKPRKKVQKSGERYGKARQISIQNFFGGSPVKKEEVIEQETGIIEDSEDSGGGGAGPSGSKRRKTIFNY